MPESERLGESRNQTLSSALELSLLLASALRGECMDTARWQLSDLVAAAEDHGITAVLWEKLRTADGAAGALRDALEPSVQRLAAQELLVHRDLRTVLAALSEAAVPTLVVKGSALAYTVYPQPYLRPRSDSDVLVRTRDVQVAAAVLHRCGYTPAGRVTTDTLLTHQSMFRRTDERGVYQAIDLHWKLANPHMLADALPFDLLWDGARSAPALGTDVRVPSHAASVVLACMHRVAHHQDRERLIWLYDLKLLTASMDQEDWATVCSLACSRGVASLCLGGLRRAKQWLGAPLPASVEGAFASAATREESRAYVAGRMPNRAVLMSDLRTLRSWRARFQLLREHIFPPEAFIRRRYETSAQWSLPVFYLHRLFRAIFKWARE